ncbi:MAG: hypothetical protein JNK78_04875 [Planctomycetes bacterium]|nr:hypothetical protein [Planctomycetota bacterium]
MHSHTQRLLPLAASALLSTFAFAQVPMTFGNLVVVRVGDNTSANSNAATPVFLDEYTPAGTLVQSITLPTAASGANHAFSMSGTATSEGQVNVSTNGIYFTLAGYDAAPGTAAIATSAVATNPRVIARVDIFGNIDTSTALTDAYDVTNIRGAVSDDGLRFWTTGATPASVDPTDGVRFIANIGDTTSVRINAGAPNNCRYVSIFHGDLYVTSASGSVRGVARLGNGGLPTSTPEPIVLLNGFPTSAGPSPYDMFFASPTTIYVADDATNGGGGIKKWELISGTWTNTYNLTNGNLGCIGLSGYVQNGVTTLWATSKDGGGVTSLVSVVDNGAGSPWTTIVPSLTNARFRGVRRISLPSNSARFPIGCGAANIKVTGNAELGTNMFVSMTNSAFGFSLLGYGLFPAFFPFCGSCTIAHEWTVIVGATDHTLTIAPSWATLGLPIYAQGADLLAPGGCADPLLTLTDAVGFTIQ